jgi:hypothetical protein
VNTKWHLGFKGILANLIIQPIPRMWNHQWKEIFDTKAKIIEDTSPTYLQKFGIKKENISGALKRMGLSLDDFKMWIDFSAITKGLMEKGIINFDLIKDQTLLGLILLEAKDLEALSNIWNPDTENP